MLIVEKNVLTKLGFSSGCYYFTILSLLIKEFQIPSIPVTLSCFRLLYFKKVFNQFNFLKVLKNTKLILNYQDSFRISLGVMLSEATLIFLLENQEIFANVILSLLSLITLNTMWIFVGKKTEVKVVHFGST